VSTRLVLHDDRHGTCALSPFIIPGPKISIHSDFVGFESDQHMCQLVRRYIPHALSVWRPPHSFPMPTPLSRSRCPSISLASSDAVGMPTQYNAWHLRPSVASFAT
jgi:hypothetical protein